MKGRLVICSDSVVVDQRSNNASVFNVIEQLQFPSFPQLLFRITVLALLVREDGDVDENPCRVVFRIDDREIFSYPANVRFQEGKTRMRLVAQIGGVPIPQTGVLEVSVEQVQDGDEENITVGSWLIDIVESNPNEVVQPELLNVNLTGADPD